jgi:hypothetical protein
MSPVIAVIGSIVAGVVIAVLGVFGGVNALTGATNPASASDSVVMYDSK